MTVHRQMPSEVEPEGLGELIADCISLPELALPHPRTAHLTHPEHHAIAIPDDTVSLVEAFSDYGA
jgi:hypothetical protein